MNGHSEALVQPSTAGGSSAPKVVVGVDGTAANWSAVSWAVAEARRAGRPLLLVASGPSTVSASAPRPDDLDQESSDRLAGDLLENVRRRVTSQVREVSTLVSSGAPSEALLRCADEQDLLVVGKRRGNPWSSAVLGSTAVAVAERCMGPVVVVPEAWSSTEHLAQHIVAGIDRQGDSQVLDLGFSRAHTLGVGLAVVHASSVPSSPSATPRGVQPLTVDAQQTLADLIAPWEQEYPNVDVTLQSLALAATVSLLGAATDAQLLVVGRHTAPTGSGGPFLGSTTRKILHHASCPVIIVPAPTTAAGSPLGPR